MKTYVTTIFAVLLLAFPIGWVGLWTPFTGELNPQTFSDLTLLFLMIVMILVAPIWFSRVRIWANAQEDVFWKKETAKMWFAWIALHLMLPLHMQLLTLFLRYSWNRTGSLFEARHEHVVTLRLLYICIALLVGAGLLF